MKADENLFLMKTQQKLYRYALSLTKDATVAKDLFQETALKIWEQKDKWSTWDNFEAYSMRMIRNAFINHINKKDRHHVVGLEEYIEHHTRNEIEREHDLYAAKYQFDTLLSGLPEIQKAVLYLREIEEYEYKEIGVVLNLSESQVKVYIHRGRNYIRSKLNR
jgi:RNA polymerase sigma factor (sigma-70 family)